MFYVVEFTEENDGDGTPLVDIIPSCWFRGKEQKECYWPMTGSVSKAVKCQTKPDPSSSSWRLCRVRVLGMSGKKRVELFNALTIET